MKPITIRQSACGWWRVTATSRPGAKPLVCVEENFAEAIKSAYFMVPIAGWFIRVDPALIVPCGGFDLFMRHGVPGSEGAQR